MTPEQENMMLPEEIKERICNTFKKEDSPYMYDSLRAAAYYGYKLGRTVGIDRERELEEGLQFIENNYGNHDAIRTKIYELLNNK